MITVTDLELCVMCLFEVLQRRKTLKGLLPCAPQKVQRESDYKEVRLLTSAGNSRYISWKLFPSAEE